MKKSLLALAVLGAFAGAASAQSSVTLSGMLDAAVQHTGTATGYDWALGGAGSAFNNITLSGKEDLGGGMSAFFTMNNRFRIQNGTINSAAQDNGQVTFWRNVFVGLGGNFGDVRLGRMLMPLQEMNGNYDPWYGGYTVASTHTGGITATIRAQQAIYYRSPSMSGFSVHAAVAAANGQLQAETQNNYNSSAPPFATNQRLQGFALNYAAGPLKVTGAYDRNYADFKTTGVYGQYNFGVAIVNVQYENGDGNNGSTATSPKEKVKAYSIAADIPFGVVTGKIGYLRYDSDQATCTSAGAATGGTLACDASKIGVGGEYNLSKRTLIYSDMAKSSGDRLSVAQGKTQFDLGLRHKF
jgi:predicted porin